MAELDEQQLEQVNKLLNQTVNGAVATLKRQLESQITKTNESTTTALGKLLDEKLQALRPADDPPDPNDKTGKGKGKDLQIATLEKKVNESLDAIRAANEKAAKAESRRREIERNNLVDTALAKSGITDPFMRELAAAHFDRRGFVQWSGEDEESSVIWNGADGVQIGFDEGLSTWMKGDEAKRFLPPRGASGSGSRQPARVPADPKQKKEVSFEDIGNAVLGLVNPLGAPQSGFGE